MENKEIIKKYSIKKTTAYSIMIQVVLMILAGALSIYGVVRTCIEGFNLNRVIIYGGQALVCLAIIIYATVLFNKKDVKYFKSVLGLYALVETIRVSLLQTGGVPEIYGILAKICLVLLACDCALLIDRVEDKKGYYISLAMIILEVILYIVYLVGFPIIRTRLLFMALPFIGIMISVSLSMFVYGRLEQIKHTSFIDKVLKKK